MSDDYDDRYIKTTYLCDTISGNNEEIATTETLKKYIEM